MESSTVLLLVVVASIAVGFGIAVVVVRGGRRRAQARLAEVPGAVQRSMAASSLGLEGLGPGRLNGTGTLVLTDVEVAFAQWRPDGLVRIPRSAITVVDTTRTHLDKSMKTDLLRIRWNADGVDESIAFFVRDLDPWLADLGGTRTPPGPG